MMSPKLAIFELDNDEVNGIMKVFKSRNLIQFFPEIVGEESAHEAMDAIAKLISELNSLAPKKMMDELVELYHISVELTDSQIGELLKYCYRLTKEDVASWGYPLNLSKEVINGMWCIKEGLIRAARNIDQPLNW